MSDLAEDYAASGLHVVCNSRNASSSWTKGYWQSNDCPMLHNFYGNIDSTVIVPYGYNLVLGFKVLIDRDGNIRKTGFFLEDFYNVIADCTGGP